MSSGSNYRPSGKLQGDDRDIPMTDNSCDVGYDYGKSRPGMSYGQMKSGHKPMGSIAGATKSDGKKGA